ncbi:MAG TPA: peptide chain release factor N(5)-glutamine methyltransferase [Gemmatimonadaceae bacterium]
MRSIHEHVAAARHRLVNAGLSRAEADLSARVLAEHVLGWSSEQFYTDGFDAEPDGFGSRYEAAIARRAARQPLPYITGEREFWGLSFEVTPDVLIPRPETELLVEAALELYPDKNATPDVVDVCTGSGCVGVALAIERPLATVLATDISEAALTVARRNARRLGVEERIRFMRSDVLANVPGEFDLIVANPPYVRSVDRNGLQPEVREEPALALYSGQDGLDAIGRLVEEAPGHLRDGGHLVFEFGFGQEIEVERLIAASGSMQLRELRRDLQGIARATISKKATT